MQVFKIMTTKVASRVESDTLGDAARLMAEVDCWLHPGGRAGCSRRLVGVVTDRDIAMTAYRTGKPAPEILVRDAITAPAELSEDASAAEADT